MVSGRSDLNAYNQSSHIQIRLSRTFFVRLGGKKAGTNNLFELQEGCTT